MDILKKIIQITKQAGEITLKYYNDDYKVTTKFNDPKVLLTTADVESEKFIIKELNKYFPEYQILAEEQENEKIDFTKNIFMIDPLDGTRQFVNHEDTFSVMIGLYKDSQPYLGVIYLPVTNELYYAQQGSGAFYEKNKRLEKLQITNNPSLEEAKVFQQEEHHKGPQSDLLKSLPSQTINLSSGTGLKICQIAKNEADIFINTSQRTSKWDICAAEIILKEASGMLTDFSGDPVDYQAEKGELNRNFFATNKSLHGEILQRIDKE